ncbi:hypothetical protein EIN_112720 [Entamoeba invadens IP1]|uniref:CULT domain-containing protein n=1 Tax=Entamoeba invadens IP1 TaxID=370355 RepID=A0A0A1TXY0_ENTIV|nr:hypothetical protein EIN_112720 [Entamoeba invadens IP1]ELP86248.1 hypothetical protein EIN_112720 [Entamoeba invadens IP1]|eukprot:XP_004185594.1 hypothetical protein EIN_112720 [Entamoeba invadens IP1]
MLEKVTENEDFANLAAMLLPLTSDETDAILSSETVDDVFDILLGCCGNFSVKCKSCKEQGNETVFAKTNQIFSEKQKNHVNQFGYTFSVTTVETADNLIEVSEPNPEFSWFEGYNWQIIVCVQCGTHVGWKFTQIDRPEEGEQNEEHNGHQRALFYGIRSDTYVIEK